MQIGQLAGIASSTDWRCGGGAQGTDLLKGFNASVPAGRPGVYVYLSLSLPGAATFPKEAEVSPGPS